MPIDFNRTFGQNSNNVAGNSGQNTDRPQAKVWLNIGYNVDVELSDGTVETRFISLPVGIALDTMEPIAPRGRNVEFLQLTEARNKLLQDLQAAAKGLAAGEEETLNGLELQLRRVSDPVTGSGTPAADNPFVRKVEFANAD